MVSSPDKFKRAIGIMQMHTHDPTLQRLGDTLRWLEDRELHSAMSTVMRHVQWMQSPLAGATLRASTFDPRELRQRRATLYLILPARFMTVMQPLLRTWLGSTLRVVTRRGADRSNPILYLIDEAAQVGKMQALEDAVTLYRGYGIRCWFFWQSQDQMKACFGERANVIAGNMDVSQYFGVADWETAEAISKRIGDYTVTDASVNKTKSWSRPLGIGGNPSAATRSESVSVTTTHIRRRLMEASEIMTLPASVSLTFLGNRPAIMGWLIYWYGDPAFRRGITGKCGTGKQQGLSIAAAFWVLFTLAASWVFSIAVASFVSSVPVPPRRPGPAAYWGGAGQGDASRPAYVPQRTTRYRRPLPSRRRPTEFSRLIPIR